MDIIDSPSGTIQGITYTNNGDQSYTVKGTSTGNDAYINLATFVAPFPEWLTAGTKLGLRCSNENARLVCIPRINGVYQSSVYAGISDIAPWTVPQNMDQLIVRFKVSNSGVTVNDDNVRGMICYKSLGDIDPSLVAGAKPNHDLTQLESEDRAALAEEIDAGAKNMLNFDLTSLKALNTSGTWSGNSYTKNGVTFTYNDSTKTISTYGTSTSNNVIFYLMNFTPTSGKSFTISGCPSGGSSTGYRFCNMGTTWANDYGSSDTSVGDGISKEMAIYISTNGTAVGTSSNPLTWELMICTKAAFGVSKAFVPYRPNWDLVSYLANAGGFVNNANGGIAKNADLNAITTSCFRVYNSPSNLPPNESGYCFCKTYVYDTSSALQELYMHDYPTRTYKRFKINGTWKDWAFTGGSTNILINFNPSAAQTWELAYTITIPGKSMLKASASLLFTNSPVRGILMTTSTTNPTNGDDLQCIDQQDSSIKCMMNINNVYINSNSGSKNIYIFAKQNSAGVTNRLLLSYEISRYSEV